jgi:hypothetical protein
MGGYFRRDAIRIVAIDIGNRYAAAARIANRRLTVQWEQVVDPFLGVGLPRIFTFLLLFLPEDFPFAGVRILPDSVTLIFSHSIASLTGSLAGC